jgi:hypothetical protein
MEGPEIVFCRAPKNAGKFVSVRLEVGDEGAFTLLKI